VEVQEAPKSTGHFLEGNKKPAEAGFFKTIPTSCRQPPRQWSIILDPERLRRFSWWM